MTPELKTPGEFNADDNGKITMTVEYEWLMDLEDMIPAHDIGENWSRG